MSAKEYQTELKKQVQKGAKSLPIIVEGAAWSAIKIDKNHTRIILIDQGYIEPQDREVMITFQHRKPKAAKDILSNEVLKIKNNQLKTLVLAGSLQFIDITY